MARFFGFLVMLLWIVWGVTAQDTPEVYIQAVIDNPNPYIGQPITYSLRIFDSLSSEGLEIAYPDLNGFGQELPTTLPPYSQVVDGTTYTIYGQDIILYPNTVGTFALDPALLRIPESPFQSAQTLQSTQVAINVKPLPLNNPISFRNAVGQYEITALLDKINIIQGDVVTLQVVVTGQGNLAQVLAPQLPLDEAQWRIFERSPQFTGIMPTIGTKTFEWTLIPQGTGTQNIPAIEFSFFNPLIADFVTLTTTSLPINVSGEGQSTIIVTPPTILSRNIPDLKPMSNQTILQGNPTLYPTIGFWIVPLLLVCVIVIAQRRVYTPSVPKTPALPKNITQFDQNLRQIAILPPQEAYEKIGDLLNQVVIKYASRAKMTPSEWLAQLPTPQQKRLKACIEQTKSARYAPITSDDVKQLVKNVRLVIVSLEQKDSAK